MMEFFKSFFIWLPPVLQDICVGIVVVFFIVTIGRVLKFIYDLIPFV